MNNDGLSQDYKKRMESFKYEKETHSLNYSITRHLIRSIDRISGWEARSTTHECLYDETNEIHHQTINTVVLRNNQQMPVDTKP